MTQEEFDAIEDDAPAMAAKASPLASVKAVLATQGPVRLIAAGAVAVAGVAMAANALFGGPAPVQIADAPRVAPVEAAARDLPILPDAPVHMATLAPVPVRAKPIEELKETRSLPTNLVEAAPQKPLQIGTAPDCAVMLDALPLAAATVALDIAAPCDGGARVDIVQGGLRIAVSLDSDGMAQIDLPALSASPAIVATVAGRAPVEIGAEIVDFDRYTRAIVHWQGHAGLELHAFESGADYGTEGHVSLLEPRNIARALTGQGGFVTTLGDDRLEDARMALVYTAPVALDVAFDVEVPVTAANCGTRIVAGMLRPVPGSAPQDVDLDLTMPDCDATGDLVMLGEVMRHVPSVDVAAN